MLLRGCSFQAGLFVPRRWDPHVHQFPDGTSEPIVFLASGPRSLLQAMDSRSAAAETHLPDHE